MVKRKTFTVPGTIPISRRVSEVGGQIRDWIRSLDAPDRHNAHGLRSKGFDRKRGEYHYHYEILEDAGPEEDARTRNRPSAQA
jgi:hypothetical protein